MSFISAKDSLHIRRLSYHTQIQSHNRKINEYQSVISTAYNYIYIDPMYLYLFICVTIGDYTVHSKRETFQYYTKRMSMNGYQDVEIEEHS